MITRRDCCVLAASALAGGMALGAASVAPTAPGASEQQVQSGRLERWSAFPSQFVPARPVEVWLPPSYDGRRPHAVLYMHDGQMLFDPRSTWNGQAWCVDQIAAPMIAAGQLRDFIVVGIWNRPEHRHAEFFPKAYADALPDSPVTQHYRAERLKSEVLSDAYLRFIVEELKPAVDARCATERGRDATFLMGSSMGGMISIYGLCEYPQVFGAAAALSTHWIGGHERNAEIPAAALAYLRRKLPPPGQCRLYMDRGTVELDALYDQAQAQVDALMVELGHKPPRVLSRVFEGQGHNERAWSSRLAQPLRFLLEPRA
ncbi:alpha/beta hydrolase [Paucibacter sp. KCTC 42545]|uniref:alpha/beta hydrolase n=1 Tax=Paucibacter sp. KCTC 42545 TaxID=1768242 RepID=UPI0009E9E70A|nr:alpha/beta hydrolase-fold protein [Paucibacter sp. KCTC 42545]